MDGRDERIGHQVSHRLRRNPQVDGSTIIIGVHKRHVTLRGSVPHPLARIAARADAWSVRAVKGVTDHLVVRHPCASFLDADRRLEAALAAGLGSHPILAGYRLEVAVTNGVVLLAGTVALANHREQAEAYCARQPGVLTVANRLGVAGPSRLEAFRPEPSRHAA